MMKKLPGVIELIHRRLERLVREVDRFLLLADALVQEYQDTPGQP
jgi:hypothetical protein